MPEPQLTDPNSSANFLSFLATHLNIYLSVDFSAKVLSGFVEISVMKLDEDETRIVLDAAGIDVKAVSCEGQVVPVP